MPEPTDNTGGDQLAAEYALFLGWATLLSDWDRRGGARTAADREALLRELLRHLPPVIAALGKDNPYMRVLARAQAGQPPDQAPEDRSFPRWLMAAVVGVYDPRPKPWDQVQAKFPYLGSPLHDYEMGRAGDNYGVLRELGRGGMGVVFDAYEGKAPDPHNRVALKTVNTTDLSTDLIARFEREVNILHQLDGCPNIVQFKNSFVDPQHGRRYLSMEYVFGPTLQDLLDLHAGRSVPIALAVELLRQIATGLSEAHDFKDQDQIVHRDIKPANVFLQREPRRTGLRSGWRVRVADFGLAKLMAGTPHTATGAILGTDGFLAPEQINQQGTIDGRTDVFALGKIAFQMITGDLPRKFDGKLWPQRRDRLVERGGSGPLADLVLRMMDDEQELRPHSDEVVRRFTEIELGLRREAAGIQPRVLPGTPSGPVPCRLTSESGEVAGSLRPSTLPLSEGGVGKSTSARPAWSFLTAADFQPAEGTLPSLGVGTQPTLGRHREGMYMTRPAHVRQANSALQKLLGERAAEDSHRLHVFWIGGRSGAGKSVLLLQLMEAAVGQGRRVVWKGVDTKTLAEDFTAFKRQWAATPDPSALPELLFVDDLYRPGGWKEEQADAVSELVDGDPGCPWPVVVTCGPPDFEGRLRKETDSQVIAVHSWLLEPVKAAEAGAFWEWFAHRSGKPFTPGAAFRQDEGLLISMAFEVESGGMDGFARRFSKRLDRDGLAEPLRLPLALNRLYIPAPQRWLTDDEWVRLDAINQGGDFSVDLADGAEYLRLTHPHLSDAIYKKLPGPDTDVAHANDLANACRRAWETDPDTLRLVARTLAAGNERLASVDMPFLAKKVGRAWQEANVENRLGSGPLGRDVAVSLACWRARQPELNLDAWFGVPLLDRGRAAAAGAGEAWPVLWQRLFDAYPADAAVAGDAEAWLGAVENRDSLAWSSVWRVMQASATAVARRDVLRELALDWLRADPPRAGSGAVLDALVQATGGEREPPVSREALRNVAVHWLRRAGRRNHWPTIWKRLWATATLPPSVKDELSLVAGEWLLSYVQFWPAQAEIAATVAGDTLARRPPDFKRLKQLNLPVSLLAKWLRTTPWHGSAKTIAESLCAAPALADAAKREWGWRILYDLPTRQVSDQVKRWEALAQVRRSRQTVRGLVTHFNAAKRHFLVKLPDLDSQGVLPLSHAHLPPGRRPTDLLRKELQVMVHDNANPGYVLLLCHTPEHVARHARFSPVRNRLKTLRVGDPVVGVVKEPWQKFFRVDWDGAEVQWPFTECFWSGSGGPAAVKPGDEFRGRVTAFDSSGWVMISPRPAEIDWAALAAPLAVGAVTAGTVVHLSADHGAFVRLISGLVGVVPPDHLAGPDTAAQVGEWQIGQTLDVFVSELNVIKEKLRFSLRPPTPVAAAEEKFRPVRATAAGFARVADRFPVGSRVTGSVRHLADKYALVEVAEGVLGKLDYRELSWTKAIQHPGEMLAVADVIECVVIGVDREQKRITLSLRCLTSDPWKHDIPSRYRVNDRVRGRVDNVTNFGVFVQLEAGLIALLHVSELAARPAEAAEIQAGDMIDARVIHVDLQNRKIDLSQKPDNGPSGDPPPLDK